MQTPEKDLELKDLNQFYGTQRYWKEWLDTNVTDGVHYVTENGYAWFVTDAISVIKTLPKLKKEEFLVVKLTVDDYHHGFMSIDDGNNHVLYTQKYDYTNAKVKELQLYYENQVMLLPSER